ncbi:glycosyltransferase family 4 protein [candidate division WOR-3 bacterium]|nr:glycosyltransferase family 4 protein [candidate division WOR-3 bacterium]
MKIAIVTHRFMRNEGQGRIQYELALYLAKKGHQIHLYAIEAEEDLQNMNNVYFHHIPVPNLLHILKDQIFMLFTILRLKRKNYHVLHITGANIVHPYHINNCQFCHTAWKRLMNTENGLRSIYHSLYTSISSFFEKMVYRKPGIITAASGKVKKELIDYLGIDRERISILYNGVDTDEFNPLDRAVSRERILNQFGLPEKSILVLFMGDLRSKRKGAEFLLQAFQKIRDERIKLLLVGPQRGKYYRKLIEKYKLKTKIVPMGFRKDTPDIYRAADIFVLPSLYEACSIAVLEAMATGLPCIVSKETGTSELMENGVDGIILNSLRDAEEIRQKIEFLSKNSEIREKMGNNARKKSLQYKWERMGEECEKLIAASLIGKIVRAL